MYGISTTETNSTTFLHQPHDLILSECQQAALMVFLCIKAPWQGVCIIIAARSETQLLFRSSGTKAGKKRDTESRCVAPLKELCSVGHASLTLSDASVYWQLYFSHYGEDLFLIPRFPSSHSPALFISSLSFISSQLISSLLTDPIPLSFRWWPESRENEINN